MSPSVPHRIVVPITQQGSAAERENDGRGAGRVIASMAKIEFRITSYDSPARTEMLIQIHSGRGPGCDLLSLIVADLLLYV